MNKFLRKILFWTPRVLGILVVTFLTLLSTDVFVEGYTFWQSIGGFLIHMLPTFAVILVLVLGWRRAWIGALGFIAFGVWYIAMAWDKHFDWITYAILAGIPGLIGVLFLLGWIYRKQMRVD